MIRADMSATPTISIVCFVVAALLGAVGQFLYKTGADQAGKALMSYVLNLRIVAGIPGGGPGPGTRPASSPARCATSA